jgi:hypothetical protein
MTFISFVLIYLWSANIIEFNDDLKAMLRWPLVVGRWPIRSDDRWPKKTKIEGTTIKVARIHKSNCIKVGQRPSIIGHRFFSHRPTTNGQRFFAKRPVYFTFAV